MSRPHFTPRTGQSSWKRRRLTSDLRFVRSTWSRSDLGEARPRQGAQPPQSLQVATGFHSEEEEEGRVGSGQADRLEMNDSA